MKLIGIKLGEYEGNKYAKLITIEPARHPESGSRGYEAVISKMLYDLALEILPEWELYADQNVILSYDRFGRVTSINVA